MGGGMMTHIIATSAITSTNTWWPVLVALLGSSVLGSIIGGIVSSRRSAAGIRRDGYAAAVTCLIARAEYPYRVRRRTSDHPDVLAALASRGNDLQELVAGCRTWVNAENRHVGLLYEEVLATIDKAVGPATADAWTLPPIVEASGMNLGDWGPPDPWRQIQRLERAIAYRFGWRRWMPKRS